MVPTFKEKINKGIDLPITDNKMTRFNFSLSKSSEIIMNAIEFNKNGLLYIPKAPSYRILDLANALCSKSKKKEVGIREGEKIHETLINTSKNNLVFD